MGKITRDAETQMIDKLIQVLAKLLTSHFYLNGNAREYKLLILGRFSNDDLAKTHENAGERGKAERTRLPVVNLPLCYWSRF